MNADVVNQLINLYSQIDADTKALHDATKLQCPPGCGQCCENPDIETTPLEMLPVAVELFRRGEAQQCLEKLATLNATGICIFYTPEGNIPGNGSCAMYPWRPPICRLFGFAAVTNKYGKPELAACARHKATIPETVKATQEAIAAGLSVPNFPQVASWVEGLDPYWGTQRLPINQALQLAIERVGLSWQLFTQEDPPNFPWSA